MIYSIGEFTAVAVLILVPLCLLIRKLPDKWGVIGIPVLMTAFYWFWESRAEGNIRIDLLIIYPFLFGLYTFCFWKKFRWWSPLASLFLMGLNIGFLMISYDLFDKHPG